MLLVFFCIQYIPNTFCNLFLNIKVQNSLQKILIKNTEISWSVLIECIAQDGWSSTEDVPKAMSSSVTMFGNSFLILN